MDRAAAGAPTGHQAGFRLGIVGTGLTVFAIAFAAGIPTASANPDGSAVQEAVYYGGYRDNTHGAYSFDLPVSLWPNPAPWFGHFGTPFLLPGSGGNSPGFVSRYFGSASAGVTPVTQRQYAQADVTGVHSPYLGAYGPWEPSTNPARPSYMMGAQQWYAFMVTGGTASTVTVQMEATALASGSSDFFAAAEVTFEDYVGFNSFVHLPLFHSSGAFSSSAAGGTGVGFSWTPTPTDFTAHPFTVLAGSTNGDGTVTGTGTIEFDVPVGIVQYIRLNAFAQVYDQEGATGHALADPLITISPGTPNAGQYVVVQSSNIFAIPEVDPAGMGSVLALVTGVLGLLEQRRRRTAA